MKFYTEICTFENTDLGEIKEHKTLKKAVREAIKESKKKNIKEVIITAYANRGDIRYSEGEQVIFDSYVKGKKVFSMYGQA